MERMYRLIGQLGMGFLLELVHECTGEPKHQLLYFRVIERLTDSDDSNVKALVQRGGIKLMMSIINSPMPK